jgi:hypothetical protein
MYILRIILISLIVYLIVRAFIIAGSSGKTVENKPDEDKMSANPKKGVPKSIGEYIDYEEVDKSK